MSIRTKNSVLAECQMGFWSEFPIDVIAEILCRLPAEDLISLKSVSKDWNFVISQFCIPKFCPPHPRAPLWGLLCFEEPLPPNILQQGRNGRPYVQSSLDKYLKHHFITLYRCLSGIFLRRLAESEKMEHRILALLPEEIKGEYDPSDIRDCCNGLLLIASNLQYYVANPITKQLLSVPKNTRQHHKTNPKTMHSSLVFDPSVSLSFKIVSCIRPAVDVNPVELEVFCSKTGEWCIHVLPLKPQSLYGFEWLRRSVYFNRGLYSLSLAMYLVCIDNLFPSGTSTSSSICKDCGSDLEAWAIELPYKDLISNELLPHSCGCIGVSSACFYYSNRDVEGSSMFVWMLLWKGKSSEWVLVHTISISDDIGNRFYSTARLKHWKNSDSFRPRTFFTNDDVIIIAAPKILIAYYTKTKMADVCHIPARFMCNRDTLYLDGHWIFPFSPCLLLFQTIAMENLTK